MLAFVQFHPVFHQSLNLKNAPFDIAPQFLVPHAHWWTHQLRYFRTGKTRLHNRISVANTHISWRLTCRLVASLLPWVLVS